MTIGIGSRNDYLGTGGTATYPFTFKIRDDDDLRVIRRDTTNLETILVRGVDYTVSAGPWALGGSITLTAGNLTSGYRLSIRRFVPLLQSTDLRNQAAFFPEVHEDAFDDARMVDQQLDDEVDRSVRVPESLVPGSFNPLLPMPEANKVPIVNVAGTGWTWATLTAGVVETVLSLADTALTFLQGGTGAVSRTGRAKLRDAVSVKDFGAVGDGATNDALAFTTAIAAFQGMVVPPSSGDYIIASNVTIPAGKTLKLDAGARLSISGGFTLTINGNLDAPATQHVFTGAGTVAFAKGAQLPVGWFGAVADGATDDRAAIQRALDVASDAGYGRVLMPTGTHRVTRSGSNAWAILVPSNVRIEGSATVALASGTPNSVRVFSLVDVDNVELCGFTIEGNNPTPAADIDQKHGVFCDGARNVLLDGLRLQNTGGDGVLIMGATADCDAITVRDCLFDNNRRNGITLFDGYFGVRILNNYFKSNIQAQAIDSEPLTGTNGDVLVIGNFIEDRPAGFDAIEVGGVSQVNPTTGWVISGNRCGGSIRMTWTKRVTVIGNQILGTLDSGIYGDTSNEEFVIADNRVVVNAMPGIQIVATLGFLPAHGTITGNMVRVTGASYGIRVQGVSHVAVTANIVDGDASALGGIYVFASISITHIVITGNLCKGGLDYGILVENFGATTLAGLILSGNLVDGSVNGIYLANGSWLTDLVIGPNTMGPNVPAGAGISTDRAYIQAGIVDGRADWVCIGTPEGQITGPVGSTARRTDGGQRTTFYIKESGTGNTGWKPVGDDLAWTQVAYNAGDFSANGAMTFTVAAGDLADFAYTKNGRTMTVSIRIEGATIAGTPDSTLIIQIPGGFTATRTVFTSCLIRNNAVYGHGHFLVAGGTTEMRVQIATLANWTAAVDDIVVNASITFETTT
jgi:hypothetical protein